MEGNTECGRVESPGLWISVDNGGNVGKPA